MESFLCIRFRDMTDYRSCVRYRQGVPLFNTLVRGDQTLAQLVDVRDCAVVHTLHALFCTFFPVLAVQNY